MIVYSVDGGGEQTMYFATQAEALKIARSDSRDDKNEGLTITVERCELVPLDKAAILRILNMLGGYVAESTRVAEYQNGRRLP